MKNTLQPSALMWLASAMLFVGQVACDKKADETTDTSTNTQGQSEDKKDGGDEFVAGSNAEVFTTALAADPETMDPGKMSGAPEGRLAFNLFEGLLMPAMTTEGLKDSSELVVPGVAESFDISEGGKVYTFTIRKDAKWSDGKALTSEDFVYSWKRVLTPGFPADYAQMLWVIKGAEAYNKGTDENWENVGIKAPSPDKLVVELNNPTPYFPELVAFYTFFPVPKDAVEKHGDSWTKPENIVTNGAYKLDKFEPQKDVWLKKSDTYWDAKSVALEDVRLRIIGNIDAVVNAYKTGELHWTGTSLPVAQISNLLMHPDYVRHPLLGTYFYRVNVSKDGPMKDVRVRKALSMAVDRDQLINQTLKGLYTAADSYVPVSMPGFKPSAQVGGNPKKAKKLLEEAGFTKDNPLKITVLYNTDENHKVIAESLQAMWKANLGIDVELENKEWKTYLQDVDTLSYEVARAGWIGDYNDPMTFLDMWLGENGNNDTGWDNAEFNGLIAQANAEQDTAKRLEMLQKAEAILLEDGPVIPIYWYTNNMLVSRQIEGFKPHNRDIHLFKYMSLPASK